MTTVPSERVEKAKNHLKTVMVVERDIVRKLIIPRDKNRKLTTLLSESQFNRIKKNSRFISEFQTTIEEPPLEKQLQDEEQKIHTLQQEIEHLKNEDITELEEEEQRKKQHILARMEEMKREEEDEMKQCNSLILSIKCKAIQDAQVEEKELIKRQLKSHEDAEDARLEGDRRKAMEMLKKRREEEWAKKQQYAQSILQQIQLNEEKRLQHIQMIQKEQKLIKMKSDKLQEEEKQTKEKKQTLHLQLKKQNQLFNEQIKRNKEQLRENEKLESLKIQEYLKTKIEHEKELENQRRRKKQMQERELARLWTLQKTSQSLSQTRDEIIAERAQEQIQRKWRQKEIEMVKNKIRETQQLRDIRQRQISDRRKYQTIEVCEKKEEAERITNDNSKLKEELELSKMKQKQVTEKHKAALREQIVEKERKKKQQREQVLQEGQDLQNRMQKREKIIKEAIKKKIDQIRASEIPEIYVKKLEKHMNVN